MKNFTQSQRLYRDSAITPKPKRCGQHCSVCRNAVTVKASKGHTFGCTLGYYPPNAESCPDFRDARGPLFILAREAP